MESILKNKCACGFESSNPKVEHNSEYSKLGWILYWIGISAKPIRVNFKCSVCGEIIESSTDESILKKFVGR